MKAIRLTQITRNGDEYRIHLGNGTVHDFTNMKKIKRFIVKTNKFLTENLHVANYLFIEVFSLYRMSWFYFSHNKKSMNATLLESDRKCSLNLQAVEKEINLIITPSPNSNHFVFTHFKNIFTLLEEIIRTLLALNENKSNTEMFYKFESLLQLIEHLQRSIVGYEKTKQVKSR
jgi:hypothetical protein